MYKLIMYWYGACFTFLCYYIILSFSVLGTFKIVKNLSIKSFNFIVYDCDPIQFKIQSNLYIKSTEGNLNKYPLWASCPLYALLKYISLEIQNFYILSGNELELYIKMKPHSKFSQMIFFNFCNHTSNIFHFQIIAGIIFILFYKANTPLIRPDFRFTKIIKYY